MMDDETMPAEARTHPRFRVMAKRNLRSLGDLIADRLSDAAAVLPALMLQSVSLRTIACTVRRELRAEADARGVNVVVGNARARVRVDAVGLELMLHELLHVALQEARNGDELHLDFGDTRGDRAVVTLLGMPARSPVEASEALARLAVLAERMGGELEAGAQGITLSMPVQHAELATPATEVASGVPIASVADTPPAAGPPSGGGETGYDVRCAGERKHGQSRPL